MKIKIDFSNIKDDKLYFYEVEDKNNLIEYAYIKKNDDLIYYKPEEDIDVHEFPKKDLRLFLFNILTRVIYKKYNIRIDKKSKTSYPYFQVKIFGAKVYTILLGGLIFGLLDALKFMGISYNISSKKEGYFSVKLEDTGRYLNLFAKDLYEEYTINGLRKFRKKIKFEEKKLNDKDLFLNYAIDRYGSTKIQNIYNHLNNIIDTTTEKILKSYNYPTDVMKLFLVIMPKKILNDPVDDIDNLNSKRIRMTETISHFAYEQIQQAIVNYEKDKSNEKARLFIHEDYIVKNLIGSGMLQWTTPINPLEELSVSAKVTKAGQGNPKKEQITLEKRDLNESYFGVVSPTTTNEYGGIGLNQTLVNKMMIKDRFGSILLKKFSNDTNPFENLSFSESLAPLMQTDDTTRKVMGNQQVSQFVQIDNPDVPLIQTGFEAYIPYIVSDRFAIKAKKDGKVEIKNDYIIMHYNDGTKEIFSIKPTKARTKRGLYIPIEYNLLVQNNENVKKGQILATTNSLKYGKLAIGKNLVVAEMSYRGMNYEDGWVISEKMIPKYTSKIYEKITIIIPENAEIKKFNIEKDKETKPGEILLEYTTSAQNYLDYYDNDEDEDDLNIGKEIIGNTVKYHSIGGKIKDYVIKLNSKKVSNKLLSLYKTQKAEIQEKLKICENLKKNKIAYLDCRDNIEHLDALEIGGHKANKIEPDGAIIEIYIEVENPIRNGSKFTLASTGGKGTVQYIIPKDKTPYTVETKLEIDFIATPLSIISRKNPSILLQLYIGKVVYFLNKKATELILNNKIQEAKQLLIQCFDIFDSTEEKIFVEQLKAFLENKDQFLINYVKKHDPLQNPPFPVLAPPFKNTIQMEQVEKVANILKVPLQEKVYIPEEEKETEYPVLVGIIPVYLLEHFPKAMSGLRGSINVKHQLTTGQGRSGTKEGNGAIKLGLYDMFSIISRDSDLLLKELWATKSDNPNAKTQLKNKILRGEKVKISEIDTKSENLITKKLIQAYFYGALLEPQF